MIVIFYKFNYILMLIFLLNKQRIIIKGQTHSTILS